ncbi:uncharacterized protein Tco025E_00302 [Trypanosoma conorhini]|uniref:WW domain-containing protein n=1 Tax=Trypanosoma conorhini TaxID=83891 RepID=A0A3R7LM89_9TRYP|nr:uncharacterized protein Tco025E_00302 [Trypanosoma conorhini]RNF27440.1 hypothetical protein Tco025E_00302 [Trypanosoma conorhini]
MYTFKRSQQQRQPFPAGNATAGDGEEETTAYVASPDGYGDAGDGNAVTGDGMEAAAPPLEGGADSAGQPPQEQQPVSAEQLSGQTSSAEEVLQYCREMIVRRHITPPPQWRRMRAELPASIAELRLTPSAPEPIQSTHPITPSPCVVLQLDNSVPEGMTAKEYSKSLVKYVMDLLAYQRASTAITSLRFVKIGTELSQLVLTFGRDVQLASLVLGEFAKVGLRAGFGAPIKEHSPNATFRVTDYYMTLHDGRGITAEDIVALLGSTQSPQDISVLAGYEPGVFYAAAKRPETVYAWLWNPFCSFVVQRTLFEQCGVLVTMADCPHDFVGRGGSPLAVGQGRREPGRGRRGLQGGGHGGDEDDEEEEGEVAEFGAEDDDYDADTYNDLGGGSRVAKSGALEWTRNAKDEIDIFEGIDKPSTREAARLEFMDDDITELLQQVNAEKQQQQPTVYTGTTQAAGPYDRAADGVILPTPYAQPPALQQPQQQYPYYGGGALLPPWQQEQQQQQQLIRDQQLVGQTVPLPYGTMPPSADGYILAREPNVKYPELVDEDATSALPEPVNNEDMTSNGELSQQQEQQPEMYWIPEGASMPVVGNGGILYPMPSLPPYLTQSFAPSIQLPLHPHPMHDGMSVMPSILGQPLYGSPYATVGVGLINNNINNQNSGMTQQQQQQQHSNMGILPSFPMADVSQPLPRVMTADRVQELAIRVVELAQVIFPAPARSAALLLPPPPAGTEEETEGAVTVQLASPANEGKRVSETLFPRVPCTATVPHMSAELEDLISFVRDEYLQLKQVIESSTPEVQESRRRIVSALLAHEPGLLNNDEETDWVPQEQGSANAEGTRCLQLPALLPYLLATTEGTEVVSAIASYETEQLLPLLTRYVLPFLLDAAVVRSVVAVALRAEPTAENPLVKRIIRHWEALTNWLHAYINSQAAAAEVRAEGELEHAAATQQPVRSTTTRSTVVRRLTSQVGNTIDMLLAAMSPEQRAGTKAYLNATNALETFVRSLQTVRQEESAQQAKGEEPRTAAASQLSMATLWSADGAVHRSLMRLYLNANLLDGTELVDLLFVPQSSLTRDQYYFVLVAFSKSLVSQVLSDETARACGAFLRLMEQKLLQVETSNSDDSCGGSSAPVLTEKDAVHLLDAALRAVGSAEVYTCLRDAYLAAVPPMRRYEKVEAKLARPTLPVMSSLAPPAPQHNPHHHPHHPHRQQGEEEQPSDPQSGWQAAWTAAMRNYPQLGDPFTPLPTGWTSALSRSYGHYYFKNAKGTATYKHPTDAAEFMATPQAFLQETGVTATLADVLAYANNSHTNTNKTEEEKEGEEVGATAPAGELVAARSVDNGVKITEEEAKNWLADQRIRVEALDMATLALLRITYRAGGSSGRRGGHDRSRRSSRRRRESSEGHRPHSHHHHSRKRARGSSCNAAELQRKLVKLSSYPPRGHPFPPLLRGWTCNLSSSNGLYYFRPPRGNPVYQHPLSRREYRASPQAFVLHRGIHANAIAVEAHKSVEEVERWLADQRQRDEALDAAVVLMVPIEYALSPDYDEDDTWACGEPQHQEHQAQGHAAEEEPGEPQQQQQQRQEEQEGGNRLRSVSPHNTTATTT